METNDNERFGQMLRKWRAEKNIDQSFLADLLCVNQSYICRLESGRKKPNPQIILRLVASGILDDATEKRMSLAGARQNGWRI